MIIKLSIILQIAFTITQRCSGLDELKQIHLTKHTEIRRIVTDSYNNIVFSLIPQSCFQNSYIEQIC